MWDIRSTPSTFAGLSPCPNSVRSTNRVKRFTNKKPPALPKVPALGLTEMQISLPAESFSIQCGVVGLWDLRSEKATIFLSWFENPDSQNPHVGSLRGETDFEQVYRRKDLFNSILQIGQMETLGIAGSLSGGPRATRQEEARKPAIESGGFNNHIEKRSCTYVESRYPMVQIAIS
jgi:hypothetical protein